MKKPEPLFNPLPKKIITAYDLSGKKHQRNLKNFQFRLSVYGVLSQGNKILVQRYPGLKTYGLPGGAVEMEETISEALVREFKEETGLTVEQGRLLTVIEDFFTHEGMDAHGVLVFYEVIRKRGKIIKEGSQIDSSDVGFVSLFKLKKTSVQRVFWQVVKKLKEVVTPQV